MFDREHGTLRNHVSAVRPQGDRRPGLQGPELLDGKECIVLDYSQTSIGCRWVRDEIGMIAPRLYLGKVYAHEKRLIDFALEF